MSDYGLHIRTAVPYTLALALLALFSRRAAVLYAGGDKLSRRVSLLLELYCAILLSVLLSSYVYSLNVVLKYVHYVLGTALIVLVTVASVWLYALWPRSTWNQLFLFVQLSGDVLALMTGLGAVHFLFASEILANVGFEALLIRTGRRVAVEGQRIALSYDTTSQVGLLRRLASLPFLAGRRRGGYVT